MYSHGHLSGCPSFHTRVDPANTREPATWQALRFLELRLGECTSIFLMGSKYTVRLYHNLLRFFPYEHLSFQFFMTSNNATRDMSSIYLYFFTTLSRYIYFMCHKVGPFKAYSLVVVSISRVVQLPPLNSRTSRPPQKEAPSP